MQGFKILSILLLLSVLIQFATLIVYVITEHPSVTYVNKKYLDYVTLSARRYGRSMPPIYYVDFKFKSIKILGQNAIVDFYFYEFLSNEYRRSFVEMHFKGCSILYKDPIFGAALRKAYDGPCPVLPGVHELYNMSILPSAIPPNFPFKKGRIYCNVTDYNELIASGYIDMAIKEFTRKKNLI